MSMSATEVPKQSNSIPNYLDKLFSSVKAFRQQILQKIIPQWNEIKFIERKAGKEDGKEVCDLFNDLEKNMENKCWLLKPVKQ